MIRKKYQAILDDSIRTTFNQYIAAMDLPFIDYFAIGIQNTLSQQSASLMSNLDWHKTFKENEFASYDPIRKASLNIANRIFTFAEIDCVDNMGKEVMRQRQKHNIHSGLVIMDRTLTYNFILTLATGYRHFDGHRFYYANRTAVNHVFQDLKSLISSVAKDYQKPI